MPENDIHKMNGRRVSYIFFFLAVAITVVHAQYGEVSFSGTTVTLSCPLSLEDTSKLEWQKGPEGQEVPVPESSTGQTLELGNYTVKNDGLYSCKNTKEIYYFYIKAKVCEGCVDMDMMVAFAVVFADVLITVGIVIMVYLCARKKAGTAAPQRAAQARQPRGPSRGPPTPDPDYQVLNPATRSNDVYAQANRR